MEIVISHEHGAVPITVFHIKGEMDVNTYEQFQTQAEEAFEAGTRYLLLDLSETTYLSSAGLRGLHHVFNLLRADSPDKDDATVYQGIRDGTFKSRSLRLLNPQPVVLKTLKTAGFDMYLEIHRSFKDAIASF